MNTRAQAKNSLLWLGIIMLSLLLLIGILKLISRNQAVKEKRPQNTSPVVQHVSPSPVSSGSGSLKMQTADNGRYVPLDGQAEIRVIASSGNVPIVGYDLVLSYDPSILSYVSSNHSLSSDYDGKIVNIPGRLTVSAVLKKDVTRPWILADTVIEQIHFKPLKTGKTIVTLVYRPGATDDSNMIAGDSRDILNKVAPLTLTVGGTVHLNLKEQKPIAGTQFFLRLDKITTPNSSCRDCFTSKDLTFLDPKKNTQVSFGFRSGGFAGVVHDEAHAGGFVFKEIDATDASITVLTVPE